MSSKADVLKKIERVISRLSSGLTPVDKRDGWTEESRIAILQLFQDLQARLLANANVSDADRSLNLSRGMDSWGVTGGDLLELGAEISVELRTLP